MLIETAKSITRSSPSRVRRRWFGLALGAVLVCAVAAVLLTVSAGGPKEVFYRAGDLWPAVKELKGLGAFSGKGPAMKGYARDVSKVSDWARGLSEAVFREPDIPALILDIKFKNLKKLHDKRAAALKLGHLVTGADDYVPARMRVDGTSHRVKIRLKGDLPDHYNTEKWSLRVQVKRGGQILGMRRFSLQAPKTRQYHGQPLYLDFMRRFGVLAPRYRFVNLWVNGTDIGLMALEEHFSKELLESQGRRESVILAFDESLAWEHWGEWKGGHPLSTFFYDYTNAHIRPF
ncbi:MAG: CotH kinase family protein, partial [Alphaproteobacteria bacterium]|nr:CotH kinase family protein [Alphaproteobacteria bacterium]